MSSSAKGFLFLVILIVIIVGGVVVANNRQKVTADTQTTTSDPNTAPVTTSLNPDNKDSAYIASLAKFMTAQGMTLYGASWCPHCKAQREVFGSAVSDLKYVECSSDATKPQADVCNTVSYIDASTGKNGTGIQGYPTWIYQGKAYGGEQTITQLAQIVGYVDGSTAPAPVSTNPAPATGAN